MGRSQKTKTVSSNTWTSLTNSWPSKPKSILSRNEMANLVHRQANGLEPLRKIQFILCGYIKSKTKLLQIPSRKSKGQRRIMFSLIIFQMAQNHNFDQLLHQIPCLAIVIVNCIISSFVSNSRYYSCLIRF